MVLSGIQYVHEDSNINTAKLVNSLSIFSVVFDCVSVQALTLNPFQLVKFYVFRYIFAIPQSGVKTNVIGSTLISKMPYVT